MARMGRNSQWHQILLQRKSHHWIIKSNLQRPAVVSKICKELVKLNTQKQIIQLRNGQKGAAPVVVAQPFSAACSPECDPGDRPGIESHIGLPEWSLLLPLPVSLPLSLSLSIMNK